MIAESLADIPRWLTAAAEWSACLVYAVILAKRPGSVRAALRPIAVLLVGAIALWGAQELAGTLPIGLWVVGMALAVVVMSQVLRWSIGISGKATIYLTARAFVLAELVASLHWQLRIFFDASGAPLGSWLEAALFVAVFGGGFAAAGLAERRHLPRGAPLVLRSSELITAAGIAVGTFAISNLSFVGVITPFSGRLGPEVSTIRTLVDLCGFVALYAQQEQRREQESRAESAAVQALLRTQHEQYLQSKRTLDEVDRKVHDMRNWIQAIRSEPDADRRSAFLDELEHRVTEDALQRRTGNRVLDTILAAKNTACAMQNIQLTVVADGRLLDFMSVVDITSIVGNALDNAIEGAVRVAEEDQRHIKLALYARGSLVMLRIENTFDGRLTLKDGRPSTRKDDAEQHGYGLTSIERVAERYGGTATFENQNDWFTLRVLIPARSD